MFDPVTELGIAAAPVLIGLKPEDVPSMITEAYVKVSVAKSLLGQASIENDQLFDELRSVAISQETIALNLERGQLRSSAAYVAASAYQILARAFSDENSGSAQLLEPHRISARLSSLLLYIAADAPADAAEVASELPSIGTQDYPVLLDALCVLGGGKEYTNLTGRADVANVSRSEGAEATVAAMGYHQCARRAVGLIEHLVSPRDADWERGTFGDIADAMSFEFEMATPNGPVRTESLIAGPWHLARLLDMAEPILLESSTVSIQAPARVSEAEWSEVVGRLSRRRPVLWRNHRSAIASGMLDPGISSVLTFPTGAGKSTVSELKIAASVLRGHNVICLVPTLSLLDQLANALRSTVPAARVTAQRDVDERLQEYSGDSPEIFVMTPEGCLAALGGDVARFGDVGLVVFDEAHLMHMDGETPTRRAVDASLCFLTLSSRFPESDLMLISAMLSNAHELAGWLSSITGRPAIALDSPWKPTRQARGALVYMRSEVERLRESLRDAFHEGSSQTAPAVLKRQMTAVPFGFFSLKSTWESTSTRDYRLAPLLDSPIQLAVGGHRLRDNTWWLSPNANKVGAQLAIAAAHGGLKTLVFTQQVAWTTSIARDVSGGFEHSTRLNAKERALLARAVELLGDRNAVYLNLKDDDVLGAAIPHHGLLLPEERRLHESLYKRKDGVPVLVATSTVAQGMNFPSELVVIAGDKRFDAATNERTQLQAHEILNAAGRAGRAGARSNGLVMVIPGQIVTYDGARAMDAGWFLLQKAFTGSDQCVEMKDPLAAVLDQLESGEELWFTDYLLRRLGRGSDETVGPSLVQRSLAAYVARQRGDSAWVAGRIESLQRVIDSDSTEVWVKQVAAVTGLPVKEILGLADHMEAARGIERDLTSWRDWFMEVISEQSSLLEHVLRIGSRAAIRGANEEVGEWSDADGRLLAIEIRVFLEEWMGGASLFDIQMVGIARGKAKANVQLEFARKFLLRVVPDLTYLFGLPALIEQQRFGFGLSEQLSDQHPLSLLPRCVRLGVDTAEKVQLLELDPMATRAQAHASFT